MPTVADQARLAARGDLDAFEALMARFERVVWLTARRIVRDDHAASDVTQEAFLQAFRRLGTLKDPDCFESWLLRIARRLAIRQAGRRLRQAGLPLEHAGDLPDRSPRPDSSADLDGLLDAVSRLPEAERVVVALRYFNGESVGEVASALGRPIGTVTKQLSRAIRRLRGQFLGILP